MKNSKAYTAQGIAAAAHIPGMHFVKTIIAKIDGKLAFTVLPATDHVHMEKLAKSAGAKSAPLAEERDFADRSPDCELGTMPPFDNLSGIEVFDRRI